MRYAPWILLPLALLIGLPVLSYGSPSDASGLIRDDRLYVLMNEHVVNPTSLKSTFLTPFPPSAELGLHRPITTLSFRLDFLLSHHLGIPLNEDHAFLPHLTNLLLVALAAEVLRRLLIALGVSPMGALAAGVLYLVHPARSEATMWISGRAENLMSLFSLLALLSATSGTSRWWMARTLLFTALAFLSKEQGIVLPALMLFLPAATWKERLKPAIASGVILLLLLVLRVHVLGGLGPDVRFQVLQDQKSMVARSILGLGFLGQYIRLCLIGGPLLIEYPENPNVAEGTGWILAAAFLALVALSAIKRWRFLLFGSLLFLLPLLPVLNVVVPTGETFAERFLALPLAGAAIGFGLLVARVTHASRSRIARIAIFLLLAPLAWWSFDRARDYKDEVEITSALSGVDEAQASFKRLMAGLELKNEILARFSGRGSEANASSKRATELYRQAIATDPKTALARIELLRHLIRQAEQSGDSRSRRSALAESHALAQWLTTHSAFWPESHALQGRVLVLAGEHSEAVPHLRRALVMEPTHTQAAGDLVQTLRHQSLEEEADQVGKDLANALRTRATERWWDFRPAFHAAAVLKANGDSQGAMRWVEDAVERAQHPAQLQEARLLQLALAGEPETPLTPPEVHEATLRQLRAWGEQSRRTVEAHLALGRWFQAVGRSEEARQAFLHAQQCARSRAERAETQHALSTIRK